MSFKALELNKELANEQRILKKLLKGENFGIYTDTIQILVRDLKTHIINEKNTSFFYTLCGKKVLKNEPISKNTLIELKPINTCDYCFESILNNTYELELATDLVNIQHSMQQAYKNKNIFDLKEMLRSYRRLHTSLEYLTSVKEEVKTINKAGILLIGSLTKWQYKMQSSLKRLEKIINKKELAACIKENYYRKSALEKLKKDMFFALKSSPDKRLAQLELIAVFYEWEKEKDCIAFRTPRLRNFEKSMTDDKRLELYNKFEKETTLIKNKNALKENPTLLYITHKGERYPENWIFWQMLTKRLHGDEHSGFYHMPEVLAKALTFEITTFYDSGNSDSRNSVEIVESSYTKLDSFIVLETAFRLAKTMDSTSALHAARAILK